MRTRLLTLAAAMTALIGVTPAGAQEAIRIGLIMTYSGQFADPAAQLDNGIKLYVKQRGDAVVGKKIEFIRKDVGGIAPDVAKRLAQELVVRDKVDILAGFVATPNAMAASDVSDQAKKFMVIMNAATSVVITKSPYAVRTSFTIAQVANSFGAWAAKNGVKNAYTMVSDYGPGHDAEAWFHRSFKAGGGEIVGSLRMPVANPDFAPFVQKVKDTNPGAIFVFVPGGAQPPALGKAFAERGIDPGKIKILGTGEVTDEQALKSMGDAAIGIITAYHYDYSHDSKLNREFVTAYNEMHKRNPDFFAVGGYDGMHVIYETLKRTGGNTSADILVNVAKGMKWESPRGPVSIDPETRDIVNTIYVRRVQKTREGLRNVEFDKIDNVKDPVVGGSKK
jgi:branched-chain amino acid transport system substrate-binding protein